MNNHIFDESNGLWYEQRGDYYVPCLTLPDEYGEQPVGIYGQRHLRYIQQHRKIFYTNLLTSGRLNRYLADLNQQAQESFELIVRQMTAAQGITERLKAENQMKWVGRMNNIHACADEIVRHELICD